MEWDTPDARSTADDIQSPVVRGSDCTTPDLSRNPCSHDQTNALPYRVINGSKPASNNMLNWQPMASGHGISADTGGHGRFVIKSDDITVLRHNGQHMKNFDSVTAAKEYAQGAFESIVRYADDSHADMALAA
jgi:hypothetical protein